MRAIFFIFLVMAISSCEPDRQFEFFVAPGGDDNNPGTFDEPFASLERTVQLVREVASTGLHQNLRIWLREGVYQLEGPLQFDNTLSIQEDLNVYFTAYPGETPVFSGGKPVDRWQNEGNNVWSAPLPASTVADSSWNPRELFINGVRATRARHPDHGYLRVKQVGSDRRTNFSFNSGDFPQVEKAEQVELVLLHDWSVSRIGLKNIDYQENRITAIDSIGARDPGFFNLDHWEPDPRYFLENAPEFLDQPFEWYYNPDNQRIYLLLPDQFNPADNQVVVPYAQGLLRVKGSVANPVRNLHFQGIEFAHMAWSLPEEGYAGVQANHYDSRKDPQGWSVIPAAVEAEWVENCSWQDCTFKNLGGCGIWIGSGSRSCSIDACRFSDISGNGVMIGEGRDRMVNGEPWWRIVPEQVATANRVEHCLIEDCGAQFFGAVGIWAGLTAETVIEGNEVRNLPYTGISVGWMWNPQATPSRENRLDNNHIHHIMQTLSDGGGIYMLGLQPGSRIAGNQIHHVEVNAGRAESNGMFLDEGTTDVVIENNLVYEIARSPLRFHRATVNKVRNNLFFCGEDIPPIRYNNTNATDIEQSGNMVYHENHEHYQEALVKAKNDWDFYRPSGESLRSKL